MVLTKKTVRIKERNTIMVVSKSTLTVALLLSALSSIASFVLSPLTHAQTFGSNVPSSGTYNVVIQGNIDGQMQFSQQATIKIIQAFNPAGGHPFDVCLVTAGSPITSPAIGEISLNSNAACIPGTIQQVDMTSVTEDQRDNSVTLQVDPVASAMDVNGFNTSGGVAGRLAAIVSGSMQLQFGNGDQTISGQINVVGNSSAFNPEQGDNYTATISGTLSGS
jgi:hypothetical protein